MNRDENLEPGLDRADPVAEFFERERNAIEPLPTDQRDWEHIAARAQGEQRQRRGLGLAGVAAAAAVVAAVAVGVQMRGTDAPTPAVLGSTSIPSATDDVRTSSVAVSAPAPTTMPATTTHVVPPAATGTADSPTVSTPATPTSQSTPDDQVPADTEIVSVSSTGTGRLMALAKSPEPASRGMILNSADDGRSWRLVADLKNIKAVVLGVRFSSPTTGYLYGNGLWRTTDGGGSWKKVNSSSASTITSFEVRGDTAWFVDADQRTWRYEAGSVNRVPVESLIPGDFTGWIVMDGPRAYLNLLGQGTSAVDAVRLDGTPRRVPRPMDCNLAGSFAVWPAANAPGHWMSLCRGGDTGAVTVWSDTSDQTKAQPSAGLPNGSILPPEGMAVLDSRSAVAIVRTPGLSPARLMRTSDGGATWVVAGAPRGEWNWVGAAGGSVVYATSANGFYVSGDGGRTFVERSPR